MHRSVFLPRSLLLLLLLLSLLLLRPAATTAGAADEGDESISSTQLTHLFPETPLFGYQLPCGATRRFRLHALARDKIYDLKVSYVASVPTTFTLEVARIAADDDRSDSDVTHVQRRLNTAKLRLHPSELLLRQRQQNADGRRDAQYRLALPNDDSDSRELPAIVAVDVVLRADVAGVSPFVDPRTRACVFDIVVEEMLFGGAFPFDTLALIAWIVLLLAIALKWIFPFLLRKIALELPAERVLVSSSCSNRKES